MVRRRDNITKSVSIGINSWNTHTWKYDFQGPIRNSWELMKHWKKAELGIVSDSGHSPNENLEREIVRATDRFANQ